MSTKVTIWAWQKVAPELGEKEGPLLLTLLTLADIARDNGKVWASHGYIATRGRQSPRTVRGNIGELEARGFLRTEATPGRPDIVWLNLTRVVLYDEGPETDEPGALEKGPRRPRQEMPTSDEATAAPDAGHSGARCRGGRQEAPTNLVNEPDQRTEDTSDSHQGAGALVVDPDPVATLAKSNPTQAALQVYANLAAHLGWPEVKVLNEQRRKAISARLNEAGGFLAWRDIMLTAETSAFLTGKTTKPFTPSLDFFLQASSFAKLAEGFYHRERQTHDRHATDHRGDDRAARHQRGQDQLLASIARTFGGQDRRPG